jgi:4-carboxymuconolactone decarboxylase
VGQSLFIIRASRRRFMKDALPSHYQFEGKHKESFIRAVETLGEALRRQGPLDLKTTHLVQLAASVAIRSEGGVHSHVRQALANGASRDEVYHAIIVLTSTVGFPTVSAALSWAEDLLDAAA